jgi:hypothetical protein
MSETALSRAFAFAAVVEVMTGLALLANPAIVASLLLGSDLSDPGKAVARCFGIALLGLALACWPGREGAGSDVSAWRGMLTYNLLIAVYLAYLGTTRGMRGALLWPAVLLHAAVAIWLLFARRRGR